MNKSATENTKFQATPCEGHKWFCTETRYQMPVRGPQTSPPLITTSGRCQSFAWPGCFWRGKSCGHRQPPPPPPYSLIHTHHHPHTTSQQHPAGRASGQSLAAANPCCDNRRQVGPRWQPWRGESVRTRSVTIACICVASEVEMLKMVTCPNHKFVSYLPTVRFPSFSAIFYTLPFPQSLCR